jgi:hypothetical protein
MPKLTWAEFEAAEEARQKEALRRFLEREREPMHLTGKQLWVGFWKITMYLLCAVSLGVVIAKWKGWL